MSFKLDNTSLSSINSTFSINVDKRNFLEDGRYDTYNFHVFLVFLDTLMIGVVMIRMISAAIPRHFANDDGDASDDGRLCRVGC